VAKNQQFRRILLAAAMTSFQVGVLLAANPGLRSGEPPTQREVNVYLENIPDLSWDVEKAKTFTSQIFSAIRVKLIWVTLHHERTAFQGGTIIVKFSAKTPIDFRSRALALSFPFEGIHARVFYDRVQQRVRAALVPTLLGHVLAHEIAHLLEKTDVHSDKGIMKACWGLSDYDQMAWGTLTFTGFDIRLIYDGLDARSKRLTQPSTTD
jgi:hypothetical protein